MENTTKKYPNVVVESYLFEATSLQSLARMVQELFDGGQAVSGGADASWIAKLADRNCLLRLPHWSPDDTFQALVYWLDVEGGRGPCYVTVQVKDGPVLMTDVYDTM